MTTVPLRETGSVVLSGAGAGTAKVGPKSAREVWHPSTVTVSASSANLDAQCVVYVGHIVYPAANRGSTFTGSSGDTTMAIAADLVRCGEYVHAQWTGGDPGATATLTVTGTREL